MRRSPRRRMRSVALAANPFTWQVVIDERLRLEVGNTIICAPMIIGAAPRVCGWLHITSGRVVDLDRVSCRAPRRARRAASTAPSSRAAGSAGSSASGPAGATSCPARARAAAACRSPRARARARRLEKLRGVQGPARSMHRMLSHEKLHIQFLQYFKLLAPSGTSHGFMQPMVRSREGAGACARVTGMKSQVKSRRRPVRTYHDRTEIPPATLMARNSAPRSIPHPPQSAAAGRLPA